MQITIETRFATIEITGERGDDPIDLALVVNGIMEQAKADAEEPYEPEVDDSDFCDCEEHREPPVSATVQEWMGFHGMGLSPEDARKLGKDATRMTRERGEWVGKKLEVCPPTNGIFETNVYLWEILEEAANNLWLA